MIALVAMIVGVATAMNLSTEHGRNLNSAGVTSPGALPETAAPSHGGKHYKVVSYPTPNFDKEKVNEVKGVVLHHTAEPTIERSLAVLTSKRKRVGTHVVIDTDGTRYVMAEPTRVVFHAGRSVLNGRDGCNDFTIGIEFQGNTLEQPLTDDQISSAIEYLLPLMRRYNIPVSNVVTHEMVRNAYKQKHPGVRCHDKVDIASADYLRFMKAFRRAMRRGR